MKAIKNINEIRERIGGEPDDRIKNKITDHLTSEMTDFISSSRMLMFATIDDQGFPTISPKGIETDKLLVKDKNTLVIPERKGNKLAFSLQNILLDNKVALIFLIPGINDTLRVHGECSLWHDEDVCEQLTASISGKALLLMLIEVKTAYFHCPKAFIWGEVWKPKTLSEKIIYFWNNNFNKITGT